MKRHKCNMANQPCIQQATKACKAFREKMDEIRQRPDSPFHELDLPYARVVRARDACKKQAVSHANKNNFALSIACAHAAQRCQEIINAWLMTQKQLKSFTNNLKAA